MSTIYYTAKLELSNFDSHTFKSAIYSVTPKTHLVRVKSSLTHFFKKLSDGRMNYSFEDSKVTIIAHNNPEFRCALSNPNALLHSEHLICANIEPSTFSIYYEKSTTQNNITVILYLPSFAISNCRFTKF